MTETPFAITTSQVADTVIVAVSGEIDMASAPQLLAALDAVPDPVGRVVVNLSDVGFLDSSALSALVQSQRELAGRDIGFCVVSPANRALHRVFEITNLVDALHVVPNLDDALA
jgi:anti-sigma B factor antagonist